jgi:putative hydrolase of the HAD superfamily
MIQGKKFILWDFDGTLVRFSSWRLALMDVLNECEPGHNIDQEQIRPFLRDGFPWHKPEEPHFHLKNPDDWWRALEPVFVRCYQGIGYSAERATELATQVRRYMIKSERYVLYEDTLKVLAELKEKGWKHVILSNHMPELPEIVNMIGLSPYIAYSITSGVTGYEKPHPQAFRIALEAAGNPRKVWLVGDNLASDVQGAEAADIPAILVHSPRIEGVRYYAANLSDVIGIIENNSEISR